MPTTTYTTIDGQIVSENRAGTQKFYGPDPLGSVVTIYDTTGTVTDTFTYWPYGEIRTSTGSTATPFKFCGTWGYYSDATGRLYVRARFYRDKIARWQTPSRYRGNVNKYLFRQAQSTLGKTPFEEWMEGISHPPKPISFPEFLANLPPRPTVGTTRDCCLPSPLDTISLIPCLCCMKARVNETLGGIDGGDKYLHCMGGCLAQIRCKAFCPPSIGFWKEVMDQLFGGVPDYFDIPPTNDGWNCGKGFQSSGYDVENCKKCCEGWQLAS